MCFFFGGGAQAVICRDKTPLAPPCGTKHIAPPHTGVSPPPGASLWLQPLPTNSEEASFSQHRLTSAFRLTAINSSIHQHERRLGWEHGGGAQIYLATRPRSSHRAPLTSIIHRCCGIRSLRLTPPLPRVPSLITNCDTAVQRGQQVIAVVRPWESHASAPPSGTLGACRLRLNLRWKMTDIHEVEVLAKSHAALPSAEGANR